MFNRQLRQAVALWALLWLLAPTAVTAGVPHYTVATDERLGHLDVRACFDGSMPRRLAARDERAPELLRDARFHSGDDDVELTPRGSSLALPRSDTSTCVQYRVDLSGIGSQQWRSGNWRTLDAIVLDPGLWLWLPKACRKMIAGGSNSSCRRTMTFQHPGIASAAAGAR